MTMPPLMVDRRRALLLRLLGNGVLQAGVTVATAWLIQYVFNAYVGAGGAAPSAALWWSAFGLAMTTLALGWLRRTELVDAEKLGQDYVTSVRLTLFDAVRDTGVRDLQKRSQGGALLRFIGDLNALRRWVSLGLSRLIIASITLSGALVALSILDAALAWVAGSILIAGTVLLLAQGAAMRFAVRTARNHRARLAANISEKLATLAVVQVFGRVHRERRRLQRHSANLQEAMVGQARVTGRLRGLAEITTGLAGGAVLITGAIQTGLGHSSAGSVVAAISIIGLLSPAIRDLGRVFEYRQSAMVASAKITDFLNLPATAAEHVAAKSLSRGPGLLTFEDVTVGKALRHFSAQVAAGQTVAIVGPNGAGKSTLLAAIARLIKLDAGVIRLDGQDLNAHSISSVREAVSMIAPDLPLMRGTLSKNLRYRHRRATQEELEQVIDLCDLNTLLAELPQGLQTRIIERGANLSPGQRQRIALGRALMGDPTVLLLDEAEENLDPRASLVLDRILEQRRGTTLVVTHRADRVARADWIWYLENGVLIEQGPPSELLHRAGPTRALFGLRLTDCG